MPNAAQPLRLLRRRTPPELAVTATSIALYRFGERCNHACPMCSNAGGADASFHTTEELLRRAHFLAGAGMRRVVVTGGEPTIHPGFWDVIAELKTLEIDWDINSNGRAFADRTFAGRAMDEGLLRAIISLHSHETEASAILSGTSDRGHEGIVRGISQLITGGCGVMINCVLSTFMMGKLHDFMEFCERNFGAGIQVKFAFPSTTGRGGEWPGIQFRYRDIQQEIQGLDIVGRRLGIEVLFESFPPCILGDASLGDMSRSGFGETHYLDDVTGDKLYPIAHIEAELSAFPETCRACTALRACPGIAEAYLRRYGGEELLPF